MVYCYMYRVLWYVYHLLYMVRLPGTKWEMMEQIRADIREFKKQKNLVKVTFIFLTCNLVQ